MTKSLFGQRVREQRELKGLTMEQFAEALNISYNYLSDVERGRKFPRYELLFKIIETLDVSADILLRDQVTSSSYQTDAIISSKLAGLTADEKSFVESMVDTTIENLKRIRNNSRRA